MEIDYLKIFYYGNIWLLEMVRRKNIFFKYQVCFDRIK